MQQYRVALDSPHLDAGMREHVTATIRMYEESLPRPQYTCPACRAAIGTKPTKELYTVAQVIEHIVHLPNVQLDRAGEAEGRLRRGDDVWDRYFPWA